MEYWCGTQSGRAVDLGAPSPDDIEMVDIAQALSRQCRFNGHTPFFYSVAQHSCVVHDVVAEMAGSALERLAALLHDAAEAYIGDVVRPMRGMITDACGRDVVREIEDGVLGAIYAAFGLSRPLGGCLGLVERVDDEVLRAELRDLFPWQPWSRAAMLLMDGMERMRVTIPRIVPWSPEVAWAEFLRRWEAEMGPAPWTRREER